MQETVIELQDVHKTYEMGTTNVHALQGTTLKIAKGEFLAIMGKSGSGKSTMMNIIGCLDTPTKGKLFLENRDVETCTESELAQQRGKKIGFIFQQFNLVPTLTALENVTLPGAFQDEDQEVIRKRAEQVLGFVDMQDRMHHKATELSGGQMQRVAIARALINDPDVILADEPTGALDSKTGQQVMKLLTELNIKKKKSIVIVTHDAQLAKYAQRIIELKDGKIINEKRRKK